jgi:nitrogen fixation protein NifQ
MLARSAISEPATTTVRDADAAAFDRTVLTAVLEKALGERDRHGERLARRVGVSGTALGILLMLNVPGHPVLAPEDYAPADTCEEQTWVRDLLTRNISTDLEISKWLAAIVARRAMEGNHLWEDLGLPDRAALTRLMNVHFAPLATRNALDMRWKRFIYRTLCEEEGLVQCTSPTCGACVDVGSCFPPGSAEALIAQSKQAPR